MGTRICINAHSALKAKRIQKTLKNKEIAIRFGYPCRHRSDAGSCRLIRYDTHRKHRLRSLTSDRLIRLKEDRNAVSHYREGAKSERGSAEAEK